MYQEAKEKTGRVFPKMPPESSLSTRLRQYTSWAKISRANLFTTTSVSRRLSFRDLRATGITWRAMRGDDPKKIQRGAGNALAQTTDIYIRVAEDIRPEEEKQFATVPPFPPLPEAIFGRGGFKAARAAEQAWKSRRTVGAFSSHKTGKLNCYKSLIASPAGFEPAYQG